MKTIFDKERSKAQKRLERKTAKTGFWWWWAKNRKIVLGIILWPIVLLELALNGYEKLAIWARNKFYTFDKKKAKKVLDKFLAHELFCWGAYEKAGSFVLNTNSWNEADGIKTDWLRYKGKWNKHWRWARSHYRDLMTYLMKEYELEGFKKRLGSTFTWEEWHKEVKIYTEEYWLKDLIYFKKLNTKET